jgi:Rieske Fe-S protein
LSKEEKGLGVIIAAVVVLVFAIGLFFEYNWWRGASIVTAVAGMAIIFIAFRAIGKSKKKAAPPEEVIPEVEEAPAEEEKEEVPVEPPKPMALEEIAAKKTTRRDVVKYAAWTGIGATALNSVPIALKFISPNPDWPPAPGQVKPGPVKIANIKNLSPGTFTLYEFNFGRVPLVGGLWYFKEKVDHQKEGATQAIGKDISGGQNENIDVPDGMVSYCLLCTHLGCIPKNWDPEKKILTCPCHNGLYDIRKSATVVGGPPPAPIPEIKLERRGEEIWAVDWKDIDYVKTLDVYKNKGVA